MTIAIDTLKAIAKEYKLTHVVVFGYDGKMQYVATHGKSTSDSFQAASFGNDMKKKLGWPDKLAAYPPRVKKLQDKIKRLEKKIKFFKEKCEEEGI